MAPASRVTWLRQKPGGCVLAIEQMLAHDRDPGGDRKHGDTKTRASLMIFGP